jgi:endoglucanase
LALLKKHKRLLLLLACVLTVPLFQTTAFADVDTSPVRVNQIGYLPSADKIATIVSTSSVPLNWELRTSSGTVAASGKTTVYGRDAASGDQVHHADFSAVTAAGTYTLRIPGTGDSVPFVIGANLYPDLPKEAMNYFYFHRMGIDIDAQYVPNSAFARKALHPGDEAVKCFNNWCGTGAMNARYSWADAGDFGIYPVNQAISAWTLLNAYERYPQAFPDSSLAIPERANGIPDILDEVKFGSTFMKGILPANGGLATHKIHNNNWSGFPVTDMNAENSMTRTAQPPSTNATYAVARNLSQLARTMAPYDSAYATEVWTIAKTAWTRAESNPVVLYTDQTQDADGGGDYGDLQTSDDRYAAAAEMYLTAYALSDANAAAYRTAVTGSKHYKEVGDFGWGDVAPTGTLSLLSAANDLPAADLVDMKQRVAALADNLLGIMNNEGYPVPLSGNNPYWWGSNSSILNRMIFWAYAFDDTKDLKYLKGMHRAMDYFMGNNAMRLSYITGYGEYYETDLHDRLAWGPYQAGIPYPKGWLAGGPNNDLINDQATPTGRPAAKSYAGKNTAPQAWCTKENTINWNGPLVWVAQYLKNTESYLTGGTTNPVAPAVPGGVTAAAGNAQVTLAWTAADGASGYNVKRSTTAGGPYTTVKANAAGTSYTDTGLVNDTMYYYVVSAVNAAGESPNSAQVNAKPQGTVIPNPTGSLKVQYRAVDTNPTDSQIVPTLNIVNTGSSPVSLDTLTMRYFFSKEGNATMSSWVDWAAIGAANIQRTFADTYVEISFSAAAGSIPAGGQTGDIQLRMAKSDWSGFNESNDYSFDATKTQLTDWDKVTLYQNGQLVWGVEP